MKITNVRKNSDGDIVAVKTNTGITMSVQEAIVASKNYELEDAMVGKTKNGKETLKSRPNNETSDNLSNLPTF